MNTSYLEMVATSCKGWTSGILSNLCPVSCQERLSVEHILIYCAEYIDIRDSCFNVNTVRELFDTVPHVLIMSFIRRAGLLYLI